jgi:hypothetical protein
MSVWKFKKDDLLKQYLVEKLPENENPVFGYSLSDVTTPEKVVAALELIFEKNDMYDNPNYPQFAICDEQLRYIVGSPRIALYQSKLHLKRIVYSHLSEVKEVKKADKYCSKQSDFPPLTGQKKDVRKSK